MESEPNLFATQLDARAPLAHRLRPTTLDDFLGQEHLLGPGKPLRESIERGTIGSMVFWGPPGSGKTTLARLLANYTDMEFEPFSAVTEGVARVRKLIGEAQRRSMLEARGTILFCDEIHRFNKAQQDAFLPHVEEGVITLIGATTENPSFELNSALLSRLRVFVLQPFGPEHLRRIVARAIAQMREGGRDSDAQQMPEFDDAAVELLVRHADGDARRALTATESAAEHAAANDTPVTTDLVQSVLDRRLPVYDKGGENHFDLISALHKSVRGSDVEAALYWLARMLDGGEDPMYLARRMVRIASEDVGLADPRALTIALAARDAFHFLGSPEGDLALAEAVVYLATAPKSNRVYEAWDRATQAARQHPAAPVPLHIRNAPTGLMKSLGYGKGYRYDHAEGGHATGQRYLPDQVRDSQWYEPNGIGFEKTIQERIDWWANYRRAAASAPDDDPEPKETG